MHPLVLQQAAALICCCCYCRLSGSDARASEMLVCWLVAGSMMLIGARLGVLAWARGARWVALAQIVTVWTVTAIVYVMLLTW